MQTQISKDTYSIYQQKILQTVDFEYKKNKNIKTCSIEHFPRELYNNGKFAFFSLLTVTYSTVFQDLTGMCHNFRIE